ncbi:hypothetical protein [Methylobacterium sp. 391_Methyba4]|uniref:hypothetical protein n=1 Tax=Methylobacterium sp. 391_Methyba4 TaxID=3038924 RepID=UPI00241F2F87|nr:hypothetical protein [Methylobacterium sp. 391_Methyba4]WFS09710.1 hypothetical protein P9K36_10715 [Methylobacterium sp. 391_Methyba4]
MLSQPSSRYANDTLLKAASDAVAAAVSTKFPLDEVLGPELSRLISISASVVKRHGILLEKAFEEALRASGRFEVLHNPTIPITAAADGLVASNTAESLARLSLRYDQPAVRSVNQDLVVIDIASGWAGAYSIKRGGGDMGPRLRKPLERDVASVRLLLRSYLRDQGYTTIDTVTSACIDWFGAAGLPPHLTVHGPDVDAHFGVPVIATVERMTHHLREELHRTMPGLLAPLYQRFETLSPSAVRHDPEFMDREPETDVRPGTRVKEFADAIFPRGPDQIRMTSPIRTRGAMPAEPRLNERG